MRYKLRLVFRAQLAATRTCISGGSRNRHRIFWPYGLEVDFRHPRHKSLARKAVVFFGMMAGAPMTIYRLNLLHEHDLYRPRDPRDNALQCSGFSMLSRCLTWS